MSENDNIGLVRRKLIESGTTFVYSDDDIRAAITNFRTAGYTGYADSTGPLDSPTADRIVGRMKIVSLASATDTAAEPTVAQLHADVPVEMADKEFAELAWFLYNRLDAVPLYALTPEMLRQFVCEHRDHALSRCALLAYTVSDHPLEGDVENTATTQLAEIKRYVCSHDNSDVIVFGPGHNAPLFSADDWRCTIRPALKNWRPDAWIFDMVLAGRKVGQGEVLAVAYGLDPYATYVAFHATLKRVVAHLATVLPPDASAPVLAAIRGEVRKIHVALSSEEFRIAVPDFKPKVSPLPFDL